LNHDRRATTLVHRRTWLSGFTVVIAILLLSGCCLMCPKAVEEWPAEQGVVVDKDTGEPIEGVYVIGHWEGYVGGHNVCFHAEGTRTDAQGRFVFPAWRNTGPYNTTRYQQYAPRPYVRGYKDVGGHITRMEMVRFTGTREERLGYLRSLIPGSACDPAARSSRRNLFPFFEAIYQEAKDLSNTPEDQKELEWFRYVAATMAIASDTPVTSSADYEARIKSYLEDHLK